MGKRWAAINDGMALFAFASILALNAQNVINDGLLSTGSVRSTQQSAPDYRLAQWPPYNGYFKIALSSMTPLSPQIKEKVQST